MKIESMPLHSIATVVMNFKGRKIYAFIDEHSKLYVNVSTEPIKFDKKSEIFMEPAGFISEEEIAEFKKSHPHVVVLGRFGR